MRIGIDVRPYGEQRAGIGMYVEGLLTHLTSSKNEYWAYVSRDVTLPSGFRKRVIKAPGFLWHFAVFFDVILSKVSVYHSTHSLIMPILLGKRCILTLPDLTAIKFPHYHSFKVRFLYRMLLGLAVQRAGALIVYSESVKKDLIERFPNYKDKIYVIPIAVNSLYLSRPSDDVVAQVLKEYKISFPYLLFVSTLEPRKNVLRLLEAFFGLADRFPDVHLVLVGKKGWLYESIFATVSKSSYASRVHFLGYVPEAHLASLYRGCKVFVFPSLYEGFGLTPLEAMSIGSAVAVSSVSSIPEVVGDGGVYFDPTDTKDMERVISNLLSDETLCREISQRGVLRSRNFSWFKTARKIEEVYAHYQT